MDNSLSEWDRKKDRVIVVTFNVADGTFEFSCDSTTMRRPGDIVLQRDADNVSWTFGGVNGLPNPPCTWTVATGGTSITITNDHSVPGDFRFTVTILYAGESYTSPQDWRTNPPMIRNL